MWEEFPPTAISHSFDSFDITCRQLRYFARTNELSDDIEEADEAAESTDFILAYQKTASDSNPSWKKIRMTTNQMKINNTIINKLNNF